MDADSEIMSEGEGASEAETSQAPLKSPRSDDGKSSVRANLLPPSEGLGKGSGDICFCCSKILAKAEVDTCKRDHLKLMCDEDRLLGVVSEWTVTYRNGIGHST